jgi:hypothetical protein
MGKKRERERENDRLTKIKIYNHVSILKKNKYIYYKLKFEEMA